jgi:hypothetical protein
LDDLANPAHEVRLVKAWIKVLYTHAANKRAFTIS